MKGYVVSNGYRGYIKGVGYILYATESEYIEAYNEINEIAESEN